MILEYTQFIKLIGIIIAAGGGTFTSYYYYYFSDKLIPVFGFGAIEGRNTKPSSMFPLVSYVLYLFGGIGFTTQTWEHLNYTKFDSIIIFNDASYKLAKNFIW